MDSNQTPAPLVTPVTPGPSLSTTAPGSSFRFHGDGVRYKGKLIGIDHVTSVEAQKMCWDSMMKLKGFEAAFRKQGRHKQRVWLKICSGGLRILDERTAGEMYMHEKNDISAVTRDESDPRALSYVHRHMDNYYLFYLRMANLAEPVLNDIREVCQAVDQEPAQEPPSEAPQSSALLVVEEASTLPPEEQALENVFSPRPDTNTKSKQTSAASELVEVFSIPLKDPIEPNMCHTAGSAPEPGPEPPKPALSSSQILSMFSPQPGGASYPSSPWAQQGIVGPQWAGPVGGAAVAPWPSLSNQMTAWPSAAPPSAPVMDNTFHYQVNALPATPNPLAPPHPATPPTMPNPPAPNTPAHGPHLLL